jgi:DinB superfamily
MVDVNSGPDAVRAYVKDQAARGLANVIQLIRADRDAIEGLTAGVSEEAAGFHPDDEEFSLLQVLQHLNGGLERSFDRLSTLSSGRRWANTNPSRGPGSIPANAPATFTEVRREFLDGEDKILAVLDQADPAVGLDLTADHAQYGPFNWLEWALYSYHVHPHDHVGQIEKIKRALAERVGS